MKKIYLLLLAFIVSEATFAQAKIFGNIGAGYGKAYNYYTFQTKLGVNYNNIILCYNQTLYLTNVAPAYFELRAGYRFGNRLGITPTIGYSKKLMNVEQQYKIQPVTAGDGKTAGNNIHIPLNTTAVTPGLEINYIKNMGDKAEAAFYMDITTMNGEVLVNAGIGFTLHHFRNHGVNYR